jgi:manganese transport protein
MDRKVLTHAVTLAKQNNAVLYLFHVVEGVSGQLYGNKAYDEETRADQEHLESIAQQIRDIGIAVHAYLGFGSVPPQLVRLATETRVDLLVMGGHGHRGIQDILFGTSISEVRHAIAIPVLIIR